VVQETALGLFEEFLFYASELFPIILILPPHVLGTKLYLLLSCYPKSCQLIFTVV
jgi:hypothetical protein